MSPKVMAITSALVRAQSAIEMMRSAASDLNRAGLWEMGNAWMMAAWNIQDETITRLERSIAASKEARP